MISADTTAFYILIFVLAAIALVCIALAVSYSSLFTKYKNLKEEMLRRQAKEAEAFQKVLDEAKRQSLQILDQAQAAAKEIIAKTETISNDNNADLMKLIQDNIEMQRSSYTQAFTAISENVKNTFNNMPDDIKKEVAIEMRKLVQIIDEDVVSLKGSIQESLKRPFEEAQKEAEEYKKERMKAFEEKLFTILSDISKEVLRKELTMAEHEKLVTKALEEARQRGGV